ncbi:MAG: nickel pincer cofactor biosynthesis protein LarB [Planctomycetota bacterium]|nr:MAG: nickel pincer cofactor biosynthesis protein LarB [Planctomycetota bacterium]
MNAHEPTPASLQLDVNRAVRCGYPEVIYGPGKTNAVVVEAFGNLLAAGQAALVTRVSDEQAAALREAFPQAIENTIGRTVRQQVVRTPSLGRVFVVTAGTSDRPVAEEALETLRWMNVDAELVVDIGVAGPQRLLDQVPRLRTAEALVVVAGMEGALPSVVGGWVACPIFAVPTSVGYGASFQGLAALLGMLNSCAANVAVVNIDAGFKAGYLAGMVAQRSGAQSR